MRDLTHVKFAEITNHFSEIRDLCDRINEEVSIMEFDERYTLEDRYRKLTQLLARLPYRVQEELRRYEGACAEIARGSFDLLVVSDSHSRDYPKWRVNIPGLKVMARALLRQQLETELGVSGRLLGYIEHLHEAAAHTHLDLPKLDHLKY